MVTDICDGSRYHVNLMLSAVRLSWVAWVPAALLALACDSTGQGPRSGTGGTSGSGGAGGQGGAGTALLDCKKEWTNGNSSYVVAYANPTEFSVNSETGARDEHTALISLADWADRRMLYTTAGNADHRHEISISDALLEDLRLNMPIQAVSGPPLGTTTGHTHTVMFKSCGVPGN